MIIYKYNDINNDKDNGKDNDKDGVGLQRAKIDIFPPGASRATTPYL